jgi:hypothetical protein
MGSYRFLVFSNPAPGREVDYNRWYDDIHLGEVLSVPGFTAAQRHRLVANEDAPQRFSYLAIYEIEGDDPMPALGELMARAGDGRLQMSEALGDVETSLFEVTTARRSA